jgi:hypothetical protein
VTSLVYPFTLTPGAPENVNQLNANLEAIRNVVNGSLDASNLSTSVLQSTAVLTSTQVRDVGEFGQIRAGRVLTIADFTNMGLSAPIGLWNLGNVNDFSGNSRNLTNKGSVGFASGITGAGIEAAQFTGSTAQSLYIADTGAADPFRIKTGSWGCWFRTAKRGTTQYLVTKLHPTTGTLHSYYLAIGSNNLPTVATYAADGSGSVGAATGITDVCDDRWHCAVATFDGTKVRLYTDGALEGSAAISTTLFSGAAPFNIGSQGADATTAALQPMFGRIDEAFITSDVLSDDQVRNLYVGSLTHTLGATPKTVRMRVTRRRRGGPYVPLDFPATPSRLYNFTAGALTDEGSNATTLGNAGTAPISVVGPDGVKDSGYHVGSVALAHFTSVDTGLPTGSRTLGAWFKTSSTGNGTIMGYGTISTGEASIDLLAGVLRYLSGNGNLTTVNFADGLWHQVIAVTDAGSPVDGLKDKLYVDGRLVGSQINAGTVTVTLAGAGRFRIGARPDGTVPMLGQVARPFVYAGTMSDTQVRALYNKGSQALAASPKYEGDHIETFEATRILATFDSIEASDLIDMEVLT